MSDHPWTEEVILKAPTSALICRMIAVMMATRKHTTEVFEICAEIDRRVPRPHFVQGAWVYGHEE